MICAVVDAYGVGRLLPSALRRYGVECVHVRSEFRNISQACQPEDFTIEIAHKGNMAATASELRRLRIGFVVAGTESGVLLADALSDELGTPGNGMRRPTARRNKFQMEMAVRGAGLATAHCIASAFADEIIAWARDGGEWPLVLKPVASAGADNVIVCGSADDIVAAHARIMTSIDRYGARNEAVLAQRYLAGDEHYVNTVSRDGFHRIVDIWRYHKRTAAGGRPIYDHEILLPHDDPGADQIGEYVLAVLDALEIYNGAAHTELMLTRGGPVLIECGARLGGAQIPELVAQCIGTDQVDCLAFAIARPEEFRGKTQEPRRLLTHLRCVNLISPQGGTMPSSADGWAPVRSLDSFAGMEINLPEGGPTLRTVDLASSPGYVYLSSADAAQVEADHARLRELEQIGLYGPKIARRPSTALVRK